MSQTPAGPPETPGETTQQVPVCPRHPDRVSYVRCQRCGRPACPDCQRPAAVGIQCVDCVREGRQTQRQARTIFGGRVTDGRPTVTITLIVVCVIVWFGELATPQVFQRFAFAPSVGADEPWRFLTSAFLHDPGNIMHIGFNMYALWIVGSYLEPMLGRARFLALYLVSALGGSVVYLLFTSVDSRGGVVGASGAVFGLFGALVVLNRHLGRSSAGIWIIIGINAVLGFVIPNIAWQAHLGGLLTGVAIAATYAALGRERRQLQWVVIAVVTVLLIALAALKYAAG